MTRLASGGNLEISYAAKAFATVEFVRHLKRHSIGLDVCSLGELATAERADFPARRLTLHGAGKSEAELRAACDERVGFIVVDGVDELATLASLAHAGGRCAGVILRLNAGIAPSTHAYVRTGGDDTKFGIHPRDEDAAIATLRASPQLRLAGLHSHMGSQIRHAPAYLANAAALLDAAERFARAGMHVDRLVVGGGFAVATSPGEESDSLDATTVVDAVRTYLAERARERDYAPPLLGIEPGRAIVALAGTTLYRVVAIKRQSDRIFVVVDGGIADNPRPALYGARHHVITAAPPDEPFAEMTLCGRSCENDELGKVRLPQNLRAGALLAMCATGAYTYSMAGNYNRFARPPVVGIAAGSQRLLARGESVEDLLARDLGLDAADRESGRRRAAF
jgi:diaminopimelate decarboxylase